MTKYTCSACGHIYGITHPSEPVIRLHLHVSHSGKTPITEQTRENKS